MGPEGESELLKQKNPLAEALVRAGAVIPAQIEKIQKEVNQWGGRFSHMVVELGILSEDQYVRILSQELRLPIAPLERLRRVPPDALSILPAVSCERYDLLPFGVDAGLKRLLVAMSDPTDESALEEIRSAVPGFEVELFVSSSNAIRHAIRTNFYGEETGEVLRVRPPIPQRPLPRRTPSPSGAHPGVSLGRRAPTPLPGGPRRAPTPIPGGSGSYSPVKGVQPRGAVPTPSSSGSRDAAFQPGWQPQGSMSHPASLELDAATEAAVQKQEQSRTLSERRITALETELRQTRNEMRQYQLEVEDQIESMQQLMRSRFQEHRLLMRGLFDLLVARGYLSKEELVQMLSEVSEKQGS